MRAAIRKAIDEKLAGLEGRQALREEERDFIRREGRLHRIRRKGDIHTLDDLIRIAAECQFEVTVFNQRKQYGCTVVDIASRTFVFGPDDSYIGWNL